GYRGVQPFATLGRFPALGLIYPNEHGEVIVPKPDLSGDVMVWKLQKLAAGDSLALAFTLTGASTTDAMTGFEGSAVHWEKPVIRKLEQNRTFFDSRIPRAPDTGDHERIRVVRPSAPTGR